MDFENTTIPIAVRSSINLDDPGSRLLTQLYLKCKLLAQKVNESENHDNELYCPIIFDGWLCWDRTLAGTIAEQNCPQFIDGFSGRLKAHKVCQMNGTWFKHPETGKIWSNYTNCIDRDDFKFRETVNDIYLFGYSISLITLIISLVIFMCFRSLRCTRIKIHIQLFLSLALSCISWIIWYIYVVDNGNVIQENPLWCISLHIWVHYLMLVTYFWMFCEGLHLHLVLVVVFVKDAVALRWFFIISWVLPVVAISIYAILRANDPVDSRQCWVDESYYIWILIVPVCISLVSSLIFLINVIRVLLTKASCSVNPAPIALKKAVRATLILIPLFGLQHILLPLRPENGSEFEKFYQILSAILVSLQGLAVSSLFCFANHDVVLAVMCYLSNSFPTVFSQSYRESLAAPPVTLSRDCNV